MSVRLGAGPRRGKSVVVQVIVVLPFSDADKVAQAADSLLSAGSGPGDSVLSAADARRRALLAAGAGRRQDSVMAKPKPEVVDWLEEVFAPLGAIGSARLFGGWQLRADGRPFAVVLDGTLYFVADRTLAAELAAAGGRAFRYARRGGMVTIGRFLSAPEADMDDEAALVGWGLRALAAAG